MMTDILHLVPKAAATAVAAKSGNWSDPSTWRSGRIPRAGDKVDIPVGDRVTLDTRTPRLVWVRDEGELDVAPALTTALNAETVVVDMMGRLVAGTEAAPVTGSFTMTFLDSGPIDTTGYDPQMLSRGLLSMGMVMMNGAPVQPWALQAGSHAGATSITLTAYPRITSGLGTVNEQFALAPAVGAPTGWKAGDTVVLAGTNEQANEDDVMTIASVKGNVVTFTAPLQFDHLPNALGRPAIVTDMSRRITLTSENVTTTLRRGHVMEAMTNDFDYNYVAFDHLGRTDKSIPITDPVPGQPATYANPRGRYAFHVHMAGGNVHTDTPGCVCGCALTDSPGWGYVNHSSLVVMSLDVAYAVKGAAFVGEAGDEVGLFDGDVAIGADDGNGGLTPLSESNGGKNFNFGKHGTGFWTQGDGIAITHCVAAGSKSLAYVIGGDMGFKQVGATRYVQFPVYNLPDPSLAPAHKKFISVGDVPLTFTDNVCFGGPYGVGLWTGANAAAPPLIGDNVVSGNYIGAGSFGVFTPYDSAVDFMNNVVDGLAGNFTGTGYGATLYSRHCIDGNRFVGYATGIRAPDMGPSEIKNNSFQCLTGVHVSNQPTPSAGGGGRVLTIAGNTFMPLSAAEVAGLTLSKLAASDYVHYQHAVQENVIFVYDFSVFSLYLAAGAPGTGNHQPQDFFQAPNRMAVEADTVTLNGKYLYPAEEGPGWDLAGAKVLPPALRTSTTDLQTRLGLYVGGMRLPADAVRPAGVLGWVSSSPDTILPALQVTDKWVGKLKAHLDFAQYVPAARAAGYVAAAKDSKGHWVHSAPTHLVVGAWNVLTVTADGLKRGILVYCYSTGHYPKPWG
jgi:hypothetical protein